MQFEVLGKLLKVIELYRFVLFRCTPLNVMNPELLGGREMLEGHDNVLLHCIGCTAFPR